MTTHNLVLACVVIPHLNWVSVPTTYPPFPAASYLLPSFDPTRKIAPATGGRSSSPGGARLALSPPSCRRGAPDRDQPVRAPAIAVCLSPTRPKTRPAPRLGTCWGSWHRWPPHEPWGMRSAWPQEISRGRARHVRVRSASTKALRPGQRWRRGSVRWGWALTLMVRSCRISGGAL